MGTDNMSIRQSTEQELAAFLEENPEWVVQTGKLHREFLFRDFCGAFGFMSQIALVAERSDHHPEWFNVYNRVVVDLTTHDANGITQRDFELAAKMSEVAAGVL
jgi:4a-hydroxytetrahydrobiopterin dehydratase